MRRYVPLSRISDRASRRSFLVFLAFQLVPSDRTIWNSRISHGSNTRLTGSRLDSFDAGRWLAYEGNDNRKETELWDMPTTTNPTTQPSLPGHKQDQPRSDNILRRTQFCDRRTATSVSHGERLVLASLLCSTAAGGMENVSRHRSRRTHHGSKPNCVGLLGGDPVVLQ